LSLTLGIDAGGTKLAAGLVDITTGRVLNRRVTPTQPSRGGDAVLADCLELARAVARGHAPDGACVAVPELVTIDGEIKTCECWDWRGWNLGELFAEFGPVRVDSDVRVAALAEATHGAGQGFSSFIYLTIGTGVSYTLVVDGSPWGGARGNALIVGAPPVELIASGPQLARRGDRPRAEDVLNDAPDGPAVDEVARILGAELARLVNALDPEATLIGGGLGLAHPFTQKLIKHTRPLIYAEDTRQLPILPAGLGTDAGIVGAALSVARHSRGRRVKPLKR
jgi:glucokinase